MKHAHLLALSLAALAVPLARETGGKVLVDVPPEPPEPAREPQPREYPYQNVVPRESAYEAHLRRQRALRASEGKGQGERIARGTFDFSASERCIARIKERLARNDASGVLKQGEKHGM